MPIFVLNLHVSFKQIFTIFITALVPPFQFISSTFIQAVLLPTCLYFTVKFLFKLPVCVGCLADKADS